MYVSFHHVDLFSLTAFMKFNEQKTRKILKSPKKLKVFCVPSFHKFLGGPPYSPKIRLTAFSKTRQTHWNMIYQVSIVQLSIQNCKTLTLSC